VGDLDLYRVALLSAIYEYLFVHTKEVGYWVGAGLGWVGLGLLWSLVVVGIGGWNWRLELELEVGR
jgi:hypothetical protein